MDNGRFVNDKYIVEKEYTIPDEMILRKLKTINDLEKTDRDGRSLLINASFYGRKSIIEYLLSRHVNINAKDKKGWTALHAAIQEGNIDIIKLLLENGADVHARDVYGNPPISRMRFIPQDIPHMRDIFQVLLKYGANPNEKNDFGMSVLDAYQAYPDILKALFE